MTTVTTTNRSVRPGVSEVRLRNTMPLVEEAGGVTRFAERLEISKAQASHIIGIHPLKGIGHTMARRIEAAFGLSPGSLDAEPKIDAPKDVIDVVQMPDAEAIAARMWLARKYAENLPLTHTKHLAIATGHGDAMAPTIPDGALMLVDKGIRAVKSDAVYVLQRGSNYFVRRVQRRARGGLNLMLDNERYTTESVGSLGEAGLECAGRVLLVWKEQRF